MRLKILLLLLVLGACSKSQESPEAALKKFVDLRFSDMKNLQADSFKILEKNCAEKSCTLTYTVGYTTKDKDEAQFKSEVKKVAKLVLVKEDWLISEVNNVQTLHESLEPINL